MYRSASVAGWMTTPTVTGQPASAAATVTDTTDNLVVLIIV